MSHIHLPDGVLHEAVWIGAFVICFAIIGIMLKHIKSDEAQKKVPFVGVIAALMLIFMSVPLGIIPVHLGLAALCGILAGPVLGFLAVFVVNIILALIGHGGITVVGLNTIIMGSEAVIGYYLFSLLRRHIKLTYAAGFSAVISLLISMALMVGVLSATIGVEEALPGHSHGTHTEETGGLDTQESHDHHNGSDDDGGLVEAVKDFNYFALTGWSAIAVILLLGIILEAFATSLIVGFFSRVRPDLLSSSAKT